MFSIVKESKIKQETVLERDISGLANYSVPFKKLQENIKSMLAQTVEFIFQRLSCFSNYLRNHCFVYGSNNVYIRHIDIPSLIVNGLWIMENIESNHCGESNTSIISLS
jgi:hypothetical protein